MRCIYGKEKADVVKYGKSLCLYHAERETIIKRLPIEERERLLKRPLKEFTKELNRLVKEKKKKEGVKK